MKKVICGNGGEAVVNGATCICTQGSSPCTLQAMPDSTITVSSKKVLSINDNKNGVNLVAPFFGDCKVASPVITPCSPVIGGTWAGEPSSFKMDGEDVLTKNHKCPCNKGGVISINSSGQ